jgi:hypothetical protein
MESLGRLSYFIDRAEQGKGGGIVASLAHPQRAESGAKPELRAKRRYRSASFFQGIADDTVDRELSRLPDDGPHRRTCQDRKRADLSHAASSYGGRGI